MPYKNVLEKDGIVYGLKDPLTTDIRYVGLTRTTLEIRLNQHIKEALQNTGKNPGKNQWISMLLEKGHSPEIIPLWVGSSWELIVAEITNIEKYGKVGEGLFNKAHNRPVKTSWLENRLNYRNKTKLAS